MPVTDKPVLLTCSPDEIEALKGLAGSTTAGIWRIKRAKALLSALEGASATQLMFQVRVPVKSIIRCIQEFIHLRMAYFDRPSRPPTAREAAVEKILVFLNNSSDFSADCWDTLSLSYIGTRFTARDICTIRELTATEPRLPMAQLARITCSRLQLYGTNGKPRLAIVQDILRRMAMDNIVFLPTGASGYKGKLEPPPKIIVPPEEMGEAVPCKPVSLAFVLVRNPAESLLWNSMIYHYHYIGGYRLFGPQLRYLVYCQNRSSSAEQSPAGKLLAALSFSPAAWRVSCRDDHIGWTDAQRTANLPLVLNNSRFLILPWVQIPNLASRILGAIARQAPLDWEARYCRKPVLLETFVEQDRFRGTCYKAANWIEVGKTAGYSLYGHKKRREQPARSVFLLPLDRRFRDILCQA
jgi:hypothetical protein